MSARDIVDADGHITESTEALAAFIDPAFRDYGPGGRSRSKLSGDLVQLTSLCQFNRRRGKFFGFP